MRGIGAVVLLACALWHSSETDASEAPPWDVLDARPLPKWYDESKFGVFCHWGVYSVPAYVDEWFWWYLDGDKEDAVVNWVKENKPPGFTYHDFAKDFTADLFDADEFADIVDASGARYFVLTSKHHEGFTLWQSPQSWLWNSVELGPKRDLVNETRNAFLKKPHIHFGLYFSIFAWFHPLYLSDQTNGRQDYPNFVSFPQGQDLVNRYQPELIWSDGAWTREDEYWRSREWLNWLYTESPVKDVVVVNDRWGNDSQGVHGGYMTFTDHFDPGYLIERKWENAMTISPAWGYLDDTTSSQVRTVKELLEQLARTISCNGNLIINAGLDSRGRMPDIFEQRLRDIGVFVKNHDEAIFGTSPWKYQNETSRNVWYTARSTNGTMNEKRKTVWIDHADDPQSTFVYAYIVDYSDAKSDSVLLTKPKATANTQVDLFVLNGTVPLTYSSTGNGILVNLTGINVRTLPNVDVIVLRLTQLSPDDNPPASTTPSTPATPAASTAPPTSQTTTTSSANNVPTWDDIDARPLPKWFDESKFGIFCHWGVYSVPGILNEWFWWYFQGAPQPEVIDWINATKPPGFTYADFGYDFTADVYDPDVFADIVDAAGARYFVLTSKHHEGFTLWPSPHSWQWNAVDVGPHRDLINETKQAFAKKPHIHFGLYFSQFAFFHPLYLSDQANGRSDYVEQVSFPQGQDLINRYQPELLWSDGDWEMPDTYWRSVEWLNWLYTESPVKDFVVVNDRWGTNIPGHHGGYLTFHDNYDPGYLIERKWENALSIDPTWGYREKKRPADLRTVQNILEQLARTISCNGNMLLNINLDSRGRMSDIFEERLNEIGVFVKNHGEAIYETSPWIFQNETNRNVWYTARNNNATSNALRKKVWIDHADDPQNTVVYAFIVDYGSAKLDSVLLTKPKATANTQVELFTLNGTLPLRFSSSSDGITVALAGINLRTLPNMDVIVLRLTQLAPEDNLPTPTTPSSK